MTARNRNTWGILCAIVYVMDIFFRLGGTTATTTIMVKEKDPVLTPQNLTTSEERQNGDAATPICNKLCRMGYECCPSQNSECRPKPGTPCNFNVPCCANACVYGLCCLSSGRPCNQDYECCPNPQGERVCRRFHIPVVGGPGPVRTCE